MRVLFAALALLLVAGEAWGLDYHLIQWKKDERCAILTRLPFFGNHWIELDVFQSRWEAERALEHRQKRGECPALAKRAAEAPKAKQGLKPKRVIEQ